MISRLVVRGISRSGGASLNEFGGHKTVFLALLSMLLKEIREEKHFQDGKHDKEFYQDNCPQRLPQCHMAEAVVVKVEGSVKEAVLPHRLITI